MKLPDSTGRAACRIVFIAWLHLAAAGALTLLAIETQRPATRILPRPAGNTNRANPAGAQVPAYTIFMNYTT